MITAYLDGITSEFYPKFKEKVMAMLQNSFRKCKRKEDF